MVVLALQKPVFSKNLVLHKEDVPVMGPNLQKLLLGFYMCLVLPLSLLKRLLTGYMQICMLEIFMHIIARRALNFTNVQSINFHCLVVGLSVF